MYFHRGVFALFLLAFSFNFSRVYAQEYQKKIEDFRESYISDLVINKVIRKKDRSKVHFFEPNESAKVEAVFKRTPGEKPFQMPTSSGKLKDFVKYGEVFFEWEGQAVQLSVYKNVSLGLMANKNQLFLPYKDLTNELETYGGGKYIDITIDAIENDRLTIDFNKSYNPYCVFQKGWNCPIPPFENHLEVKIPAGEKMYTGKVGNRK